MPVDPVCGMEVESGSALLAERDGETFYFCSESCRQKFLHPPNPKSTATDAKQRPGFPIQNPKSFTCPMHPEIEQDHPGDCPICGMALEPKMISLDAPEDNTELLDITRRFWIATALAVPVLMLSMGAMLSAVHAMGAWSKWIQCALATPVVCWAGWPFFKRACRSILTRQFNMFTLIALGTGSAYGFSLIAVLFPQMFPTALKQMGEPPIYFESAAIITVLVLLGQVLELRARNKTDHAIRELLGLAPKTATFICHGNEKEIPIEEVEMDDVLRVRPGEKIPVDGELTDGSGLVDEAMITGEPVPVSKKIGDAMIAGTINQSGSFLMRATRVGRDTMLAQIVNMVAQAQRSRAPIQRLADVVASYFVPAVIGVAILTFIAWSFVDFAHAFVNAIAVLIIACPCALGLATPMSIMVGVGRGAHAGVLVKDGAALETLEKIDTLVVDKTGTLTEGKPSVTKIVALAPFDENALLEAAASVEHQSEHPLASAVLQAARERNIELRAVKNFDSIAGNGIVGGVDGREIIVGTRRFLEEQGVKNLEALYSENIAATILFVAIDKHAAGLLAVSDPIKASTPQAIDELHALGLKIIIVSGDNEAAASAVAKKLRIDNVIAGVLPKEKGEVIQKLRAENKRVAMAGDGINDAPALAAADVGIAMGTGTDVAIESAGITLLKGDLRGIVRAIKLSRAVMRNIRQNLFFAFVYNLLGVPIAAGILYPFFGLLLSPMIAGAAMSLSSVSVISNALRLRKVEL